MQTWHDGLQSELPVIVALPRRPGIVRGEPSAPAAFRAAKEAPQEAGSPDRAASSAT